MKVLCTIALRLAFLFAVLLVPPGLPRTVSACPFCLGSQQATIRERLETLDASVIVRWIATTDGGIASGGRAETQFEVLDVRRGGFRVGSTIVVDRSIEATAGDTFLISGDERDGVVSWDRAIPLSPTALTYLRSLPASERPVSERLEHALNHLESADTVVANDAFDVLAGMKYEDISAHRDLLPHANLQRWVFDPTTQVNRLGVYGMLLGMCGTSDDMVDLQSLILQPVGAEQVRIGIDGVIGGYLLLAGETGLERLDREFLRPGSPAPEQNAMMSALRFLWDYGDGCIRASRLRASMRRFLESAETVELAIADLARWKDWGVTPQLIELYGDGQRSDRFVRRAVICFLLTAERADPATLTPEEVAAREQGLAFLTQLRQSDPDSVQRAERVSMLPVETN